MQKDTEELIMALEHLTSSNFNEKIKAPGVVVVDFFATWWGPCKMLAPVLEQAADQMKDVTFYKVDIDEEQELTNQFKIMSVPTLLFFKDGNLVVQNSGLIRMSELEQLIAKARG